MLLYLQSLIAMDEISDKLFRFGECQFQTHRNFIPLG